jgi:hypothetical protein
LKYRSDQPLELLLNEAEPFFLIRAQDVLSIPAIVQYAALAKAIGQDELCRQVQAAALEFADWQRDNPGMTKVPD